MREIQTEIIKIGDTYHLIPSVNSIEYYTIPVQDSILILYKGKYCQTFTECGSQPFLYDFGIKFVITMDNDVK